MLVTYSQPPTSSWNAAQIWILGLSSSLGLKKREKAANFNSLNSFPPHCSETQTAKWFCGWFQTSFKALFEHFLILQMRQKLSTKEFSVPVVEHDLLGGEFWTRRKMSEWSAQSVQALARPQRFGQRGWQSQRLQTGSRGGPKPKAQLCVQQKPPMMKLIHTFLDLSVLPLKSSLKAVFGFLLFLFNPAIEVFNKTNFIRNLREN